MENIIEFEIVNHIDGTVEKHIQIDRGNGEYTSMPKWKWDELQAEAELGGTL